MCDMMNGSMMGGMSVFGLLWFIALLLFIAALCKYLFFTKG
jgi:hypothetical protein